MRGFHVMGGFKNVVYRFIILMVAGGNTSWDRMYVSSMMAVVRGGVCCFRSYSVISILQILFRLKKDSSIGGNSVWVLASGLQPGVQNRVCCDPERVDTS